MATLDNLKQRRKIAAENLRDMEAGVLSMKRGELGRPTDVTPEQIQATKYEVEQLDKDIADQEGN